MQIDKIRKRLENEKLELQSALEEAECALEAEENKVERDKKNENVCGFFSLQKAIVYKDCTGGGMYARKVRVFLMRTNLCAKVPP